MFELEVSGAGRTSRDVLAQGVGVESVTRSSTGSLRVRVVDQSALVAAIVTAHSLGLTIVGVTAVGTASSRTGISSP